MYISPLKKWLLTRQLPKLRRKGYCITHFGCCITRKPRENIQVCVNVLPTSYRHITNCWPTVSRLLANCRPTGSLYFGQNLLAVCRPFVGRQTANSRLTSNQQLAYCRPTVDRQSADRFFGELFFTITHGCSMQLFAVFTIVLKGSKFEAKVQAQVQCCLLSVV